jgi:hypothetical protein
MNVYLIETPHQLMNALEARYYFDFKDNYIIIAVSGAYPADAFNLLLNDHDWVGVRFIGNGDRKYTIDYKKRKQNLYIRLAVL